VHSRINLTKATAKLLIALLGLSCVSRAHPWRHHAHKTHTQVITSALSSSVAFERDTDLKAGRVTLESNGIDKTISVKFGNFRGRELGFTTRSADAGNLVASDIDRDGDIDLIWIGSADQTDAVVLINQGEGNFVEVSDNASYSSELDELFNTGNSSKRSVKKHRKSSSLISSHISDISLGLEIRFHAPAVQKHSFEAVGRVADRLAILTSVRKRGPPSILS